MNNFHKFLRALATAATKMSTRLRPMVMCGPSGSGKSTLLEKIMEAFPGKFALCTSHTTRSPRPGEIEGVHYHFTNVDAMTKALNNGEFIEHAMFGGNMYGTSKAAIDKVLNDGKVCILDIETQGVRQVKASEYKPHYVFIKPPSVDSLKERLKKRKTETEESMNARLSHALAEIEYGTTPGNFDVIIINDKLDRAFADLKAYVEKTVLTST